MLDGKARKLIDPILDWIAQHLVRAKIGANQVTLVAFAFGIAAAITIGYQHYLSGLVLLLISRIGDGLDGAVAKLSKKTNFGGFLDIVLDMGFYGMIPVAFIFANPDDNSLAGAMLILSFFFNGASFLGYAILAEKKGLISEARGKKSLYFTTGLAEATETIFVFVLFCLFPQWFAAIAWVFAFVCFYTALSRIVLARINFED